METRQNRDTKTVLACFFLIVLAAATILAWREIWQGPRYLVAFFDVGQGDSAFIKTPWGNTMLIDGGATSVREKIARRLLPWDKTIDLIVLTHPDRDHVAGLTDALQYFRAEYIMTTGVRRDTREFALWEQALAQQQTQVLARAGQTIFWQGDHRADVLFPAKNYKGVLKETSNDTSIVLRLRLSRDSVLFTGDISQEGELELLFTNVPLAASILKVSHHGSKYSTGSEFLERVAPRVAVISSGAKNSYGHPAPETLEKLGAYGIQIKRTDQEGDIIFYLQ